jgi:hypothetical protein
MVDLAEEVDEREGHDEGEHDRDPVLQEQGEVLARSTRMAFILFAEGAAGEAEEERLEGGALAGEEPRGRPCRSVSA